MNAHPWIFAGLSVLVVALSGGAVADEAFTAKICAEAKVRYDGLAIAKPSGPTDAVVLLYKYRFCPETLTVRKGTTVHFINVDARTSHSVWLKEAGQEESPRYFPEESWSMKFDSPGDFPYLCGPHWESEKMVGKIVVTP
ncbi:MAG: plastocyanin/azurin family copper-binding protein [Magnetospirillum sp. WYHS-4]